MSNIYIDPGHGGKDPGAIGRKPWTLYEEDVAWAVALGVRVLLEAAGHTVATSRWQSDYATLGDRAREANEWPADCFVSIHCNSATSPEAHGVEVLHYGSASGEALAAAILPEIVKLGHRDRGLKVRRELAVLRMTTMPAALVELPFISNPVELTTLADARFQADWSRAIVAGITKWLEKR